MRDRRRICSLLAASAAVGSLGLMAFGSMGCGKKEPEPSAPGYYTGYMRPKGEVAPGPNTQGKKPGPKAGAADAGK